MTVASGIPTSEAAAWDEVRRLEAELAALRENSAVAHRQLFDTMAKEIAVVRGSHEKLHRAHTQLKADLALQRQRTREHRAKVDELRAELARVRGERNAARAAERRPTPAGRVLQATRRIVGRSGRGTSAS